MTHLRSALMGRKWKQVYTGRQQKFAHGRPLRAPAARWKSKAGERTPLAVIDGDTRAAAERAALGTARMRTVSMRGVWWMKVCASLVSAASQPAGHVWLLIGRTGLIDDLGEPDKRIVASPVVATRSATQEACQVSGLPWTFASPYTKAS